MQLDNAQTVRKTPNYQLFPISAKNSYELGQVADRLSKHLLLEPKQSLSDLAYTYQIGKRIFDHRIALTVNSTKELSQLCEEISRTNGNVPDTFYANKKSKKNVVFMFTGQGSQYSGMGKTLYESSSVVREIFDQCAKILEEYFPQPFLQYLFSEQLGKELNDTRITQPALFTIEYALAKLWISWGIQPSLMIGHSLGEYVAACIGGSLTLEEGLLLVMHRGRLMHELCEKGAMASLIASVEEVEPYLNFTNGLVEISAINSSNQVVISGTLESVNSLCKRWEQDGGICKRLSVSHAFHSFMMEPMLKEFSKHLENIDWKPLKYPIVSNLTGELMETIDGSDYWCRQLRNPVQFLKGLKWLDKSDMDVFLEIGPQPILHNLAIKEVEGDRLFLKSLDARKPEWYMLLSMVGKAWAYGVDVDLQALGADYSHRRVHVPTYPFSDKVYNINQKTEVVNNSTVPHTLSINNNDVQQNSLQIKSNINIEEVLRSFFYEILGVKDVDFKDDFFELGGDSLNAIQLQARIRKEFSVDFTLADLFKLRNIENVTVEIKKLQKEIKDELNKSPIKNIASLPKQQTYALSSSQQSIFFLNEMHKDQTLYNLPAAMVLHGKLDLELFKSVIQSMIDRHEQLRATFALNGYRPVQTIHEKLILDIPVLDWRHHNKSEQGRMKQELLLEESEYKFDLKEGPLFRVCIVKLGSSENMLLINAHHIVFDAWSMNILLRDIDELYTSLKEQKKPNLSELNIQYVDYMDWLTNDINNEKLNCSKEYWHKKLGRDLPVLDLPQDYPRPKIQSFKGASYQKNLDEKMVKELRKLAKENNTTMYTLLLTAFQVLLYRYSGQTDIIVGTPVAGRSERITEDLIGMFVNTVAIRKDLSGNPHFNELLEQVRELTLEAFTHQNYPFDKLVAELNPSRDESRPPIFSVLFSMLKHDIKAEEGFCNNVVEAVQPQSIFSKFDITLMASEIKNGISLYLEYCTDLFKDSTIHYMMDNFMHLLNSIVKKPDTRIAELEILSVKEKQKLLSFNEEKAFFPQDKTIHSLLSIQAKEHSQKIAISYKNQALTYGELEKQSNALAHYLRKLGVGTETHVAIMCKRSPQLVIAILGILKAGGTYVPIDPSYPQERINYLLKASEAPIVITQQSLINTVGRFKGRCLIIEQLNKELENQSTAPLLEYSSPEHLAYIIFTSGSTGFPKGVQVQHRGLVNYLTQSVNLYRSGKEGSFPLYSSISFDLTVTSLFLPLITGNTIFIQPAELEGVALLTQMASVHDFESAKFTPAHLELLIQEAKINGAGMKSLRHVIVGGEALSPELVKSWFSYYPNTIIYNEYGPTETVVGCTVQRITPEMQFDRKITPIGRPINNMKIYLLDDQKQLVPIGVKGEIYIGGPGVARGYLNDDDLTKRGFIKNSVIPGETLYKTGDIARYLEDGTLEYLGRSDNQVKIRGFRIELEEIKSILLKHNAVRDCVIVVDTDSSGDKRLLAYIVTETTVDKNEVFEFLGNFLPEYMIPAHLIPVSSLPLTDNGKVDKNALPSLNSAEVMTDGTQKSEGIMREDDLQNWIAELWKEALEINEIGIHDDFFKLGGHSLKILPIIVKIKPKFPNVQVQDFFTHRTIESITKHLYAQNKEANSSEIEEDELSKSELQEWILELWKEALEINEIDIHDDFFKLGGHSLKILPIIVKIKPKFPNVQVQDFFTYRNVEDLTDFLFKQLKTLNAEHLDGKNRNELDKTNVSSEARCKNTVEDEIASSELNTRIDTNGVLLTGGTGFLGAHVLYELLEQTRAHIYCLVRPSGNLSVLERFHSKMEFYFGEGMRDRLKGRVTVINSDLNKEDLGISAGNLQMIKEQINMIIHCAADVRHYGNEEHFENTNVGGTRRLLELAKVIPSVHFHYVSTISIVGWSSQDPNEYVLQEKDFDRGQILDNVYTRSKFNAEKLVREASKDGISASVYRVGNLVAHSKSGQFQENMETDAFYRILKGIILLGAAPQSPGDLDLTPIDYCSKALVKLSTHRESIGQTYHLCNPNCLSIEELTQLLQSFGYAITLLKPEKFNQFLFSENMSEEHQEALQLIIAQLEGSNVEGKVVRIDSQKTVEILKNLGVICQKPDRNLIYSILKYTIDKEFIPMPKLWNMIEHEKEEHQLIY
ncbi:Acyltransferase domain-containing protein [Bacillus sp. IT-79MI2]|uniref:non-ribosomal peptide synthetase n=1 Tax=Bacillus TaxID=1386 RepID=UPI0023DC2EE5|nr:non-ribosomal peptide synthetase [Bacillus pseudomycoides]MDF2086160.1 amino acid adenylation domain-containing protein [Bacillus pseudomycoides]